MHNHPHSKNYKIKEIAVRDFATETFQNVDCKYDKTISGGCSRRCLDLSCDMGSHVIIVELDENQHNSYEEICEIKRILQWSQQHRPVVFIRFNPDAYTKDDIRVPSCFKMKNGILCLSAKQNNTQW